VQKKTYVSREQVEAVDVDLASSIKQVEVSF